MLTTGGADMTEDKSPKISATIKQEEEDNAEAVQ